MSLPCGTIATWRRIGVNSKSQGDGRRNDQTTRFPKAHRRCRRLRRSPRRLRYERGRVEGPTTGREREQPGTPAGQTRSSTIARGGEHGPSSCGVGIHARRPPLRPRRLRGAREGTAGLDPTRSRGQRPERHHPLSPPRRHGRGRPARARVAWENLGCAHGRLRPRRRVHRPNA